MILIFPYAYAIVYPPLPTLTDFNTSAKMLSWRAVLDFASST